MGWGKTLGRNLVRGTGFGLRHTKGALVVGGVGYGIYSGQGALNTWGDWALGKDRMDQLKKDGVAPVIGDALLGEGGTDKAVEKGKELISGVGDAIGGVKEGASGLFGGLGNLVGNIFGNGTSSLVGLIAAGLMLFGNFGWMGKIVCGLVAAMSFGLFGGGQQAASAQQLAAAPAQGQVGGRQQPMLPETEGNDEDNGQVIYRPRR
jgi:hypothetical protein